MPLILNQILTLVIPNTVYEVIVVAKDEAKRDIKVRLRRVLGFYRGSRFLQKVPEKDNERLLLPKYKNVLTRIWRYNISAVIPQIEMVFKTNFNSRTKTSMSSHTIFHSKRLKSVQFSMQLWFESANWSPSNLNLRTQEYSNSR